MADTTTCVTCETPLRKKQCRACLIDMTTWTNEHLERYIAKYKKKVKVADGVMDDCGFRTNHCPVGCRCDYIALGELKEKIRKAEAVLAARE